MKLAVLTIENFKGIKSFKTAPTGSDVEIYGDNATGKTTIADAISWLLFDKDSLNNTNFEIKPLDDTGAVQHGLEPTIEATWIIGPKTTTLKKAYQEKWTKKRGSANKMFTGNTTQHWIDGVPVQKKEYDEQVKEIAEEQTFKLLTNPRFFNESMHWEKRRELLLEVCGNITDADVIASNKDLSDLADILGDKSVEKQKKVIAARRTEINKELESIPVRIDEATKGIIDEVPPRGATEAKKSGTEDNLKKAQSELQIIESGGEVALLKKERAETEAMIFTIKNDLNNQRTKAETTKAANIALQETELEKVITKKDTLKKSLSDLTKEVIPAKKIQKEELLKNYRRIERYPFNFKTNEVCPTCGQDIPQEKLEAAEQKAKEAFNQKKAEDLQANIVKGKAVAAAIENLEVTKDELGTELEQIKTDIESKQAAIQAAKDEEIKEIEPPKELAELQDQVAQINESIANHADANSDKVNEIKSDIEKLEGEIKSLNADLLHIKENSRIKKRIDELQQKEKELSAEYEELERQLHLIETFTRTKVEMLDEKINSKFKIANFELFKEQINGGLKDVCETSVDGVPYGSLNNAARIQSGLDIINTLQSHFNVAPLVIVDNRESITVLPEMECQMISLTVPPPPVCPECNASGRSIVRGKTCPYCDAKIPTIEGLQVEIDGSKTESKAA